MSALSLRFAAVPERAALEDLQRRASLMHEAYRQALLANPDLIALPRWQLEDRRVRVAQERGRTVGFSVVLPRDQTAILDGLFVEPEQWKRGIGRALVQDAFALAREGGARMMEVTANPYAEGFYVRLGFARTGTGDTALGIAAKMRCSLPRLDRSRAGT